MARTGPETTPAGDPLAARFSVERTLDRDALVVRDHLAPEAGPRVLRLVEEPHAAALERELTLARAVVDPHVARVLDLGRLDDGRLWFAQELVPGEDPFAWVPGRPAAEVALLVAGVLRALDAYHREGLVPGGARPLRLRVADDPRPGAAQASLPPRVALVDPGGVSLEGMRGPSAAAARTSGLAPERLVGAVVDRRANLYELGVLVHELLAASGAGSGAIALGPNDAATRQAVALSAFALLLMSAQPDDRPGSASEALATLATTTGLDLGPPLPGPRPLRPARLVGHDDLFERLIAHARPLRATARDRGLGPAGPGLATPPALSVLAGEPGAGKRAICDRLAIALFVEGALVVRATGADPAALGPVEAALRAAAADGAPLGPRARLVLGDAPSEDALPPLSPRDAQAELDRTVHAASSGVLAAARRAPVVLVVDGLEDLAPAALTALVHLARRAWVSRRWHDEAEPDSPEAEPPPRLWVLGTVDAPLASGGEGSPRLPRAVALALTDAPFVAVEHVAPLPARALPAVTAAHLDGPCPDVVQERLALAARGLPGRVVHLLRDALGAAPEAFGLRPRHGPEDPPLPRHASHVDDLVLRLEAAEPATRALARLVALAPTPAPLPALARAVGLALPDARARVHALARHGLVVVGDAWCGEGPDGADRAAPASPALRRAVRRQVDRPERAALSRALLAASADAPRGEAPPADLARLALAEAALEPQALEAALAAVEPRLEALGLHARRAAALRALARCDAPRRGRWRARELEAQALAGRAHWTARVAGLTELGEGAPGPDAEAAPRAARARWVAASLVELDRGTEARRLLARGLADARGAEGPEAALERARLAAFLAEVHGDAGEVDEARAACDEGLEALRAEGLPRERAQRTRARLLGLLGQVALSEDDLPQAEQMLKASLALFDRLGARREAAKALHRLGNVAFARGQLGPAEQHWRASQERFDALEDGRGAAQARSSLALLAARRGSLADARALLRASLRLREELGDRHGMAASLHNLGFVYASAGALPEAAAAWRACLELRRDLGDRWFAAAAEGNLGQVLLELGRTAEADALLRSALADREALGDRRGEAATVATLGEVALRRGQFDEARRLAARAQRIREELGEPEDLVDSARRTARVHLALGGLLEAQRAAERAVALVADGAGDGAVSQGGQTPGDGETPAGALAEAGCRLLLGEVLARRGSHDRARRELERARRAGEAIGDRVTARAASLELAALALQRGKPDDARALLDSRPVPQPGRLRPLEGRTPPDRLGVLRARERLLRARIELAREKGSLVTAARCAEEALEEARRAELREVEWRALQVLAATAELRGDHERALALTVETQERVEELVGGVPDDRRQGFLAADPLRAAALRGDSPVVALEAKARLQDGSASGEGEPLPGVDPLLRAMLEAEGEAARPAPERASIVRPSIDRPPVRRAAEPGAPAPGLPRAPELERAPASPPAEVVLREDFMAIVGLSRAIVDEPDIRRVYEASLQVALRLCRAERGFLAVFGEGPDAPTVLASQGMDEVERPRERFARRCAFKAAETGELVLSGDVGAREPGGDEGPARLQRGVHRVGVGLRSVLAAPVTSPDGRLAALYLDHPFQFGRFGRREVELLEVVADQCAMAVGRGAFEGALQRQHGFQPGVAQRRFLEAKAKLERVAPVRFGDPAFCLVGRSAAWRQAVQVLEQVAPTEAPLLVEGPPGAGKGLVARAVHAASGRTGELVVVDLRELAHAHAEVELFGHVAGAFEGAAEARLGLLRQAEGGTLLFERLDAAAPELQAKLVRALDERSVRPVGGEAPVRFDARVIATATDTDAAVRDGRLREDLLLLVGTTRVRLRPLDERPEDKGPLVDAVLAAWGDAPPALSGPARAALEARAYPGNLRELKAVLRAAAARARGRPVRPDDLPAERAVETPPLAEAVAAFERDVIERAVRAHAGDLGAAAKALGITRRAIARKLAQHGIEP